MKGSDFVFDIEIVDMCLEHIDDIMVVEHLSFKIPWSKDAFVQEITANKFARYFTARVNGMVAGYAGLWKVYDEGHITNIAVHPEYRGIGVGSLLLEKMLQMAKDDDVTSMTLEVRKSNVVAQNLYSKYGFLVEGSRKAYYADTGEDAIIMWKRDV